MRTPGSLPARARLRFALLAFLVATSACDNSSEPDLVPAPDLQSCVDYGNHLHVTGSVSLDDYPIDMLIAESFLYAAARSHVQVFDLSDPDSPLPVSTIQVRAQHLAMTDDGRLCVTFGRDLNIVDVTDPTTPLILHERMELPFGTEGIAVRGDCAYLAAGDRGLWSVDLSAPSQPRIMGSVDTPGHTFAIALAGNVALMACNNPYGLHAIDITNPTSPQRLGFLPDVTGSTIEVEGNVAYLCGMTRVFAVDISTPSKPSLLRVYESGAQDMVVDEDRAYVCGSRFSALSVLDPAEPVTLGTIDLSAFTIALHGTRVYLGRDRRPDGGQIDVVDISNPMGTAPLARLALQRFTGGLAIRESTLYLCTLGGFIAYSIEGQMPISQGSIPIRAIDVTLVDTHAYLAALDDGLTIVDLEIGSAGTITGGIDLPGDAIGVTVSGHRAYVVIDDYGLWIVDVEDPAQCRVLGSVDTPGHASDVAVRDPFAFVSDSNAGLMVVDTSVPDSPRIMSTAGSMGDATSIALSGDFAYMAGRYGLEVFDISYPRKPDLVATVPSRGWRDIEIDGALAYLGGDEMMVIDISNPHSPRAVGSAPAFFTIALALDDTHVFLSQDGGLTVFPRHCDRSGGDQP